MVGKVELRKVNNGLDVVAIAVSGFLLNYDFPQIDLCRCEIALELSTV